MPAPEKDVAEDEQHQPGNARPVEHWYGCGRNARIQFGDGSQPLEILGRLRFHHVQCIVMGDNADQPLLRVDHRQRNHVVAGDFAGGVLDVGIDWNRMGVALHQIGDLDVAMCGNEILEPDRAEQMALAVDDISAVDGFLVGRFMTQHFNRLLRIELWRQGRVVRRHQRAGRAFLIGGQLPDVFAFGLRKSGHQRLALLVRQLLVEVGAVVSVHLHEDGRQISARHDRGELRLKIEGEIAEYVSLPRFGCFPQDRPRMRRLGLLQCSRNVGRMLVGQADRIFSNVIVKRQADKLVYFALGHRASFVQTI